MFYFYEAGYFSVFSSHPGAFFPLCIYFSTGWSNYPQTSERVTYKSSSKPRARFLSGPVSLSICLYLLSSDIASLFLFSMFSVSLLLALWHFCSDFAKLFCNTAGFSLASPHPHHLPLSWNFDCTETYGKTSTILNHISLINPVYYSCCLVSSIWGFNKQGLIYLIMDILLHFKCLLLTLVLFIHLVTFLCCILHATCTPSLKWLSSS